MTDPRAGQPAGRPAQPDRPVVVLVGALDTKHEEYGYLAGRLAGAGVGTLLLDIGVLDPPGLAPDVDRERVARAGGSSTADLVARGDRNEAMTVMADGAAEVVGQLVARGEAQGAMAVGGSNAGYVMGRVSARLPVGVPKMLVSTMVAGDTRPYVGASDLTMMYPVVDVAGLNSISRGVLARAADALAGMVKGAPVPQPADGGPVVACSMFGVTTTCVEAVQDALVGDGAEVHVFHGTGVGGASMESMIRSGAFTAVADLTTSELTDELCGGICSAGPDRLTAAAELGVPQVVSTGALDMVNFGALATVPQRYAHRRLHAHNPTITLMRTDPEECAELGRQIATRLNRSVGPVEVHVPARGFSQISVAGAPFHDPVADQALIEALQESLDPAIELQIHDAAINDPAFSDAVTQAMRRLLDLAGSWGRVRDEPGRSHDDPQQEGPTA